MSERDYINALTVIPLVLAGVAIAFNLLAEQAKNMGTEIKRKVTSSGFGKLPPRRNHEIVICETVADFGLWCADNRRTQGDQRIRGLITRDSNAYIRAAMIEIRAGDRIVFVGNYKAGAHYNQIIDALKQADKDKVLEGIW